MHLNPRMRTVIQKEAYNINSNNNYNSIEQSSNTGRHSLTDWQIPG